MNSNGRRTRVEYYWIKIYQKRTSTFKVLSLILGEAGKEVTFKYLKIQNG
jgi:hypothetical protein